MPERSDRRFPNISAGLISKQGMTEHHENYATMSILCQWLIHSNIRHVKLSVQNFLFLRFGIHFSRVTCTKVRGNNLASLVVASRREIFKTKK